MISKTEYYLHNLKAQQISGPFESTTEGEDSLCQAIVDLSLPDGEWLVTEHVTEVSEKNFRQKLDMWIFKQKEKKKKKDVEADGVEITKGLPKIITGEVLN